MMKSLVALVTGGASGLGKATAEHLLASGARGVVILDLPTSAGEQVARDLSYENCIFVPGNVTSESDVQSAIGVAKEKFKCLTAAINCAGVAIARKTISSKGPHALDEFSKVIHVCTYPFL